MPDREPNGLVMGANRVEPPVIGWVTGGSVVRSGVPRGSGGPAQPLARACTRSSAPLKWLWSPTYGPDEVYCHIV